jgi:glycosyltransferase involved in cell wall biosynthesis
MDALLMPSDHEGLPMTVLEAMSLRVPVIGHAAGGLPEVLEHGRCGVLLNNQDANAWAGAFRKLMAARDRDVMVDRALLRLHDRYSAAGCATAYIALYEELVRGRVRREAARGGR